MSRKILRVLARGVAPALAIFVFAVLHVVVRGTGLALFGLVIAYKAADAGLSRAGHAVPRPHWNPTRPRPIPAPEVTPA